MGLFLEDLLELHGLFTFPQPDTMESIFLSQTFIQHHMDSFNDSSPDSKSKGCLIV